MKNKLKKLLMILSLNLLMLAAGCTFNEAKTDTNLTENENETQNFINENNRYETTNSMPITDKDFLYHMEDDLKETVMYLTVQKGAKSDGTNHTWKEINDNSAYYYDELGIDRYAADAILQIGDENGPIAGEFGYDAHQPNAKVSIRGQTSTYYNQKSYKISINDGKGSYKNQTVINLNKHVGDSLRFRNKLSYDLMGQLEGMMSARTEFVHLYVKDLTQDKDAQFEDYGLYTQVEQINRRYLKNHGLDSNGQLYKVNYFEFYPYEDVIKLSTDKTYDVREFEKYLEIKGNDDHSKLIEMLKDINDYSKPIEESFSKWFDEENVFSWLAFNILTGNRDTQARNVYLYSPLNVDKWYFISWDNDASFMSREREILQWNDGLQWQTGISNYWSNQLFQRLFKSKQYREKLDDKINEYKSILKADLINGLVADYDLIVSKYVKQLPDINYLPVTLEQRQEIMQALPLEIEKNYQEYLESLKKPQPFFIGIPQLTDEGIHVEWDTSYDFSGEEIRYSVELSDDYSFENPIFHEENLFTTVLDIDTKLEAGKYFLRIKATNESGESQYAFDCYVGNNGNEYGIKCFYVTPDNTILEDTYEE